jgi:hypothetical protein
VHISSKDVARWPGAHEEISCEGAPKDLDVLRDVAWTGIQVVWINDSAFYGEESEHDGCEGRGDEAKQATHCREGEREQEDEEVVDIL